MENSAIQYTASAVEKARKALTDAKRRGDEAGLLICATSATIAIRSPPQIAC
jgi:hypothetical protein